MALVMMDPEKSEDELLTALDGAIGLTLDGRVPGAPMGPFAALQVKIARAADARALEADRRAQEIIRLTKWLMGLTVALLFLTAVLAVGEVRKLMAEPQPQSTASTPK